MIQIIFVGKPIFIMISLHLFFDLNLVIRLLMIATEGMGTGSPVADHLLELHRQCRNSTYAPPAGPFLIRELRGSTTHKKQVRATLPNGRYNQQMGSPHFLIFSKD